jgi:hypothetical protein
MTLNARAKGQRGEREVVKLLQPVIDRVYVHHGLAVPELERNLMQSRNGGYDIVGLEWMALEVKRVETDLNSMRWRWWQQARSQAKEGQEPVLFYRTNHSVWSIMMYGHLCVGVNGGPRVRSVVDIDLASFMAWFELRINHQLTSEKL